MPWGQGPTNMGLSTRAFKLIQLKIQAGVLHVLLTQGVPSPLSTMPEQTVRNSESVASSLRIGFF